MKDENTNLLKARTFAEMREALKTMPKPKYLYRGITEKSFGLIFGPAKSGKSIFCENLAMSIAVGRDNFLGTKLDGKPKKTLFIGLEEFWTARVQRNVEQYKSLSQEEMALYDINYLYQEINFPTHIITEKHWSNIQEIIINSKAEVVIIDSITRLNTKKLEDSSNAEKITKKLRGIAYDLGVTLICIHHTHKLRDCNITMDSIKGSGTFAQESDFAIGVSRSSRGHRYFKDIMYRYAQDDDQTAHEFEIDATCIIEKTGECEEDELLNRTDGRRSKSKQNMVDYFESKPEDKFPITDLVVDFKNIFKLKERSVKKYATELFKEGIITNDKGVYQWKGQN